MAGGGALLAPPAEPMHPQERRITTWEPTVVTSGTWCPAELGQDQLERPARMFPDRLADGGQRGASVACLVRVVEAEQSHIVGHADLAPLELLQHPDGHAVIGCDHGIEGDAALIEPQSDGVDAMLLDVEAGGDQVGVVRDAVLRQHLPVRAKPGFRFGADFGPPHAGDPATAVCPDQVSHAGSHPGLVVDHDPRVFVPVNGDADHGQRLEASEADRRLVGCQLIADRHHQYRIDVVWAGVDQRQVTLRMGEVAGLEAADETDDLDVSLAAPPARSRPRSARRSRPPTIR